MLVYTLRFYDLERYLFYDFCMIFNATIDFKFGIFSINFDGGAFNLLLDFIEEVWVLQNRMILTQFYSKFQEMFTTLIWKMWYLLEFIWFFLVWLIDLICFIIVLFFFLLILLLVFIVLIWFLLLKVLFLVVRIFGIYLLVCLSWNWHLFIFSTGYILLGLLSQILLTLGIFLKVLI